MAKNNGVFPLSGSIGNLTFSETRHGNVVSNKSSLDRERVMTQMCSDTGDLISSPLTRILF